MLNGNAEKEISMDLNEAYKTVNVHSVQPGEVGEYETPCAVGRYVFPSAMGQAGIETAEDIYDQVL